MHLWFAHKFLALSAVLTIGSLAHSARGNFEVKPFTISLSSGIPRLQQLVNQTRLPDKSLFPQEAMGANGTGIDIDTVTAFKNQWLNDYDWDQEQAVLNSFKQYTVNIQGLDIHFVHETSADENAIPLILLHGWPSAFDEYTPTIDSLIQRSNMSNGTEVSFHVVIPSLPGFTFSSSPPANWTVDDTAGVFNTLMTDVLGYKKYAVHGTDWGSGVAWSLYDRYSTSVRAAHFVFLPLFPPSRSELAANNITLSTQGEFTYERFDTWSTKGLGYFELQSTKPNAIGFGLWDNPVGQLSWIAEKFVESSDPNALAGAYGPSNLNTTSILTVISLYYLTESYISASYIYYQNGGLSTDYIKANTDAPLLFASAKYNIAYWPPEYVAKVGNLVHYTELPRGGHFVALDNTDGLVQDLREIANYWE